VHMLPVRHLLRIWVSHCVKVRKIQSEEDCQILMFPPQLSAQIPGLSNTPHATATNIPDSNTATSPKDLLSKSIHEIS
jgi:hypothetical protein